MSSTNDTAAAEMRVIPDLGDELTAALAQVEVALDTCRLESEDGAEELPLPGEHICCGPGRISNADSHRE